MDAVDLCGRESGSIWTKKPVPSHKDGWEMSARNVYIWERESERVKYIICEYFRYLLRISNTRVGLTAKGRRLQFVKTAFGCDGGWFVAADQLGVICHFSIHKNRWASNGLLWSCAVMYGYGNCVVASGIKWYTELVSPAQLLPVSPVTLVWSC